MNKCFIQVVKVEYNFKDQDSKVYGIEINLAPKVKKFISMNKDNIELMNLMGNRLAEWYYKANVGDDIILTAEWSKDKVVNFPAPVVSPTKISVE